MNSDLCIDEPAKRLFSPNGFPSSRALQQQFNNFGNEQMGLGNDQDFVRQLNHQQMLQTMQIQALGGNQAAIQQLMLGEENKPFKCPVRGWSSDKNLKELGRWNQLYFEQGIEGMCLFLLHKVMGVSDFLIRTV